MYDLHVTPDIEKHTITGTNTISFKVVKKVNSRMQVDLQEPLIIDSAFLNKVPVTFTRDGHTWFIDLPNKKLPKSVHTNTAIHQLQLFYHGVPKAAVRAPWDGGLVWKKDKQGIHGLLLPARDWAPVYGGPVKITRAMNQTVHSSASQFRIRS